MLLYTYVLTSSFSRTLINFLFILAFFFSCVKSKPAKRSNLPTAGVLTALTPLTVRIILTHTTYSFHGWLISCQFDDRL